MNFKHLLFITVSQLFRDSSLALAVTFTKYLKPTPLKRIINIGLAINKLIEQQIVYDEKKLFRIPKQVKIYKRDIIEAETIIY